MVWGDGERAWIMDKTSTTYHVGGNPPRMDRKSDQPILGMFIIEHLDQKVHSGLRRTISRTGYAGDIRADGSSGRGDDGKDWGFCG